MAGEARCRCCGRRRLSDPRSNGLCTLCYEECTNEGCVIATDDALADGGAGT